MIPQTCSHGAATTDTLQQLEGVQGIRLRPAMYIGGTDSIGLHHLAWEVIDNSFDEYGCGNARSIHVHLHADGSLSCADDGGGIPVDPLMTSDPRPWVEVVCTEFFAGGRFQRKRYGEGSCFGVGLVAVNALCEWMVIETSRAGRHWRIRFERGAVAEPLAEIDRRTAKGTRVWFKPDPAIFHTVRFDYNELRQRLHVESCLWPGILCSVFDDVTGQHQSFHSTHGVVDLLHANAADPAMRECEIMRIQGSEGSTTLDCAIRCVRGAERCVMYANGIQLNDGGTISAGFRGGLLAAIRKYAREQRVLTEHLNEERCLSGIEAVVAVRLARPQFEGPVKDKLSNPEIEHFVSRTVANGLTTYFAEDPHVASQIVGSATSRAC